MGRDDFPGNAARPRNRSVFPQVCGIAVAPAVRGSVRTSSRDGVCRFRRCAEDCSPSRDGVFLRPRREARRRSLHRAEKTGPRRRDVGAPGNADLKVGRNQKRTTESVSRGRSSHQAAFGAFLRSLRNDRVARPRGIRRRGELRSRLDGGIAGTRRLHAVSGAFGRFPLWNAGARRRGEAEGAIRACNCGDSAPGRAGAPARHEQAALLLDQGARPA